MKVEEPTIHECGGSLTGYLPFNVSGEEGLMYTGISERERERERAKSELGSL